MKKINVLSFHSIKGGVGKTTICLLTFLKLAIDLRKRWKSMPLKTLANYLWVIDLDIGGRPMFYKPLSAARGRDFTLLDILSSQRQVAERRMLEQAPYIVCKDSSPTENPNQDYTLELLGQEGRQVLDTERERNLSIGRFLGMFLEDAVTHFSEASPTDYYRLVDRTLSLIAGEFHDTAESHEGRQHERSAGAKPTGSNRPKELEEPVWLLVDCPAGWQRANRAIMHVIQDQLRWNTARSGTTLQLPMTWQPVWITTPENYLLTKSIEWLIEPDPGTPGFVPTRPALLYNMLPSSPASPVEEPRASTDLALVSWAMERHEGIQEAFRRQGYQDSTSEQEVPLLLPAILPKRATAVEPGNGDVFAMALGEPLSKDVPSASFSKGHCYSPPPSVRVSEEVSTPERPLPSPPPRRENAPTQERKPSSGSQKKIPTDAVRSAIESALTAAQIGGVTALIELQKILPLVEANLRSARPGELVKLAEKAAALGMPDIAYAFYSVLRRKTAFVKDFDLVAGYLRFLLENKYVMPDVDPLAKSRVLTSVARFHLERFRNSTGDPLSNFNYAYFDAMLGGPARAQTLLYGTLESLPSRPPEEQMIAISILPLVEDREKSAEMLLNILTSTQIRHAATSNGPLALKIASTLMGYVDDASPNIAQVTADLYEGLRTTPCWTIGNIRPWAVVASESKTLPSKYVGRLWNEVYIMARNDSSTINGFCAFLRAQKRPHLVRKVRAGKKLTAADLEF